MSNNLVSAQCYIQYTYDTTGNRIKREYVGGCAKPTSKNDVEGVEIGRASCRERV